MNLYYLDANNQPAGPITADDIPDLYARHVLQDDTLVAVEGSDEWFPLSHVVEAQHHEEEEAEEEAVAEEPVEQPTEAKEPSEGSSPPMQEAAAAAPGAAPRPARKRYVIGNTVSPPQQSARQPVAAAVPYVSSQPPALPRPVQQRAFPVYQSLGPNPYAQTLTADWMPGIGRLAFFGISIAWLMIVVFSFLGLIGGAAFVAISQKSVEHSAAAFAGVGMIWLVWGFVMSIIWVVVCVQRARNIGWPGWLIGLIAFFLSALMPLLWIVLQMMPTAYSRTRKLDSPAIIITVIGGLVVLGSVAALLIAASVKPNEDATVGWIRDPHARLPVAQA